VLQGDLSLRSDIIWPALNIRYSDEFHAELLCSWYCYYFGICNPVRFDGIDFLEKLKGKKIMFIGDSVSVNHYESLLCLLHAAVPDARITTQTSNSTNTVTFQVSELVLERLQPLLFQAKLSLLLCNWWSRTSQDHGVSISVFETHYLVDIEQEQIGRVLKLESIKDGNTWKDMDVLVFNTWLWWYRRGPKQPYELEKLGKCGRFVNSIEKESSWCSVFDFSASNFRWDYVQEGQSILKDMDRMVAFQKGLTTWAKWVDSDVDTSKTTVIFQGISPFHYQWGSLHFLRSVLRIDSFFVFIWNQ